MKDINFAILSGSCNQQPTYRHLDAAKYYRRKYMTDIENIFMNKLPLSILNQVIVTNSNEIQYFSKLE